ncbi:MAG: phage virion morphogenesis protein [Melioribacteraceae bacterium]|nr:phage virion morphogenesis protein [Melioribacteraceae bacterium]
MAGNNNIDQINAIIANLKSRFTPNKSLMGEIVEQMYASVQNEFQTQGAGSGGWRQLRPASLKHKQKKGLVSSILQSTDQLRKSLQSSATEDTAIVSTNVRYAAIHNYGGAISIAARTRTLFHRTDAKGNLLKQKSNSNLLVFAKTSHKRKISYTFGQKNYNITIPARPFMVLTDTYRDSIINIIRSNVLK